MKSIPTITNEKLGLDEQQIFEIVDSIWNCVKLGNYNIVYKAEQDILRIPVLPFISNDDLPANR